MLAAASCWPCGIACSPAAHHLGQVGGDDHARTRSAREQLVHGEPLRDEQRKHHGGHEQEGDDRHAADQLDVGDAERADGRHRRSAPERERHRERNAPREADRRQHEASAAARPRVRSGRRRARDAAAEQHDRERPEQRPRAPAARASTRRAQRSLRRAPRTAGRPGRPPLLAVGIRAEQDEARCARSTTAQHAPRACAARHADESAPGGSVHTASTMRPAATNAAYASVAPGPPHRDDGGRDRQFGAVAKHRRSAGAACGARPDRHRAGVMRRRAPRALERIVAVVDFMPARSPG